MTSSLSHRCGYICLSSSVVWELSGCRLLLKILPASEFWFSWILFDFLRCQATLSFEVSDFEVLWFSQQVIIFVYYCIFYSNHHVCDWWDPLVASPNYCICSSRLPYVCDWRSQSSYVCDWWDPLLGRHIDLYIRLWWPTDGYLTVHSFILLVALFLYCCCIGSSTFSAKSACSVGTSPCFSLLCDCVSHYHLTAFVDVWLTYNDA